MSSTSPESSSRFTVGRWAADPSVDELRADGRIVKLEPRTMRLLSVLAQTPGQLVGTDQLMDTVWPGVIVTPGSLYEAIGQLRKVLGPDHVDTVPRKGYRLVAPVVREAPPATEQAKPTEPPTPSLGPRSIAVLPFRTRGLPDSHAFVSESLADDLIADLSRQPGLAVIARGTMLGYVGLALPPKEISRQLGVRYVVDGLLEVRGQALHATVQLVDTEQGTQSWADAIELPLSAWPEAGHLVSGRLARALNFEVLDLGARTSAPSEPGSQQALALSTRSWLELFGRPETRQRNERASQWAEEALALDPHSALASTCLAFCHWREAQFGWSGTPPNQLLRRALAHAERSIDLGPRDPDAYYVLGLIAYGLGEAARAEEALRHTLRLSSSHAPAYGLLALIRTRRGHPEEAQALCDRAFALSPREPLRVVWHLSKAWAALAMNEYESALEESQRAMAVNPDFSTCYLTGAAAAQQLGATRSAIAWVAFLRERTVFKSLQAVRSRLPPSSGEPHAKQIEQVVELLRQAGLPAD